MRTLALVVAMGAGCGAAATSRSTPPTYVVSIPRPEDEPPPVAVVAPTPPRVVPSGGTPEVPAWHAPGGHGDPCATWTSEKGLFDCDARNEDPPDAGAGTSKARH
ncbi:MAG TPA: hypothetical protein VIF09_25815 [Polyangiaceae bacterium]